MQSNLMAQSLVRFLQILKKTSVGTGTESPCIDFLEKHVLLEREVAYIFITSPCVRISPTLSERLKISQLL